MCEPIDDISKSAAPYLEKAKPVQPLLELYFNGSGWRVAQQKNELHWTRVGGDDLRVWDFVIHDPFSPVRNVIHDKDMTAFQRRVSDMPPVENELAMNAVRSESGGQSNCVIHALAVLALTFECRVTGESIMERLAQGESAEHKARGEAG